MQMFSHIVLTQGKSYILPLHFQAGFPPTACLLLVSGIEGHSHIRGNFWPVPLGHPAICIGKKPGRKPFLHLNVYKLPTLCNMSHETQM